MEFNLTKAELVQKMDLFAARVQRNPHVNSKVKRYVGLNLAVLKSRFVSEQDMKYGLSLMCEFCDDIRSIDVRRQDPALEKMNPLFEAEIEQKIALTPEERKEKIVVDFTRALKFGGMRDA